MTQLMLVVIQLNSPSSVFGLRFKDSREVKRRIRDSARDRGGRSIDRRLRLLLLISIPFAEVKLDPSEETPLKPPPPPLSLSPNGKIRYRTPSAEELSRVPSDSEARMKRARKEFVYEKIQRFRGVKILIVAVPFLLVSLALFLMAGGPLMMFGLKMLGGTEAVSKSYAVVFDAGSSGSRVHVFCFDENLNLLHIGKELELFVQKKPGLSSYAKDPKEAAKSLIYLLKKAEEVVPTELRQKTPVTVGATAGLRALGAETSEQILQEVRDLLQHKSSLKFKPDWVTVLDGSQEGAFQWVTINYLLGKVGKSYTDTVGIVDLGGGSVQMAYAISERDAEKAPEVSHGGDSYVKPLFLKGIKYNLYVHSYLHYGLLAARAEILKVTEGPSSCILGGYNGLYNYGGKSFLAQASPSGASFSKCRDAAIKALRANEPECKHLKCTFGGIWNGGGGEGQKNLFVASFFYDRASEAGFIDGKVPTAMVMPSDFKAAAERACQLSVENAKSTYPLVKEYDLPYLCMDLVYQYTLLVDGFAVDSDQAITLVKQVKYGDAFVEAAWPLGSAIEVASSP